MNTTTTQKEFCENLKSLIGDNLNTWMTSNDIDSPSHYTLIDESVENGINFSLTDDQAECLKCAIGDIYDVVKGVKK